MSAEAPPARLLPPGRALQPRCQHGMTLLEVVVSVLILGIVLMSVLQMLPSGVLGMNRAHQIQVATAYAVTLLDEARLHPPAAPGVDYDADRTQGRVTFHVVREVRAVRDTSMLDVTVTVTFRRGAPLKYTCRILRDAS